MPSDETRTQTRKISRQILECATKFDGDMSSLACPVEDHGFIDDNADDGLISRHANTCKLKLALADRCLASLSRVLKTV